MSAQGEGAQAGRCKPGRLCDGWAVAQGAAYVDVQYTFESKRKARRARRLLDVFPQSGGDDADAAYADSDANLIPESTALAQVLAAYPGGKALRVRLLPGPPPVYAVRLRVDGQVLLVRVDAQSGQILGY
ncbi:MAG: PepSY domain-containing protein [Pseudomonadota bacterium]|nr:PepSY domain-containing protein [Pseudomonadota bacterium]